MAQPRRHLHALTSPGERCSMPSCTAPIADPRLRCCASCRRDLLAAVVAHVWRRERETYVAQLIDDRDELAAQLSEPRLDGLVRVLARYVEVAPDGDLRLRDGVEHYLDLLATGVHQGPA